MESSSNFQGFDEDKGKPAPTVDRTPPSHAYIMFETVGQDTRLLRYSFMPFEGGSLFQLAPDGFHPPKTKGR